jgi:hypothetical protein
MRPSISKWSKEQVGTMLQLVNSSYDEQAHQRRAVACRGGRGRRSGRRDRAEPEVIEPEEEEVEPTPGAYASGSGCG